HQDDFIGRIVTAARVLAEQRCRRAFINQTWEVFFDRVPVQPVFLPIPPLVSVESASYWNSEHIEITLDENQYRVTPGELGRFELLESLPHRSAFPQFRIEYVCGYGENPENVDAGIKNAISILIKEIYD